MTIEEIWATCKVGGLGLIALLTLIQISPLKLNPWTPLGNLIKRGLSGIAKLLNKEVIDQVKTVQSDVTGMKKELANVKTDITQMKRTIDRQGAINARARILRFGDELLHGMNHSKDHFDSILRDAHYYESYCTIDKDFENGVTGPTIQHIRSVYQDRLNKNDFL